jgi:hypothetical protein
LADDNTALLIIEKVSLNNIRIILQDFSEISGLHCNYDKTALLPMNPVTVEERQIIIESGFKQVESIKLLGAVISSDWTTLPDNFTGITEKI